jgi:hypothetical protein
MTRFTDRVTRDLHQIADRSTPSSTAWDSIRTRIDEQTDQPPTMEVIMLSPDRNDSPKRGWMLAAAAVAGLALVGGLVFATANSDDDTVPADTPAVTVPAEPAPDAEVDPDTDAAVVPAPDPTTAAEVAPEPVPEPVTVTLTGTFSTTKEFKTVPSRSGLVGDQTWVGKTRFEGQVSGTAYDTGQAWNLPDGTSYTYIESELTASIDGLGIGTLTYGGASRTIDGVWSAEGVIAGGTAAFEGASGTWVLTPDPATPTDSGTGTYEWTITVPPKGSLQTVTATGTVVASGSAAQPGDRAGETVITDTRTFTGSMVGAGPSSGTTWDDGTTTIGSNTTEFTGTIEGLGTGTMNIGATISSGPDGDVSSGGVSGGTGDFEGISGSGRYVQVDATTWEYTFILTAPVKQ